MRSIFLISFVAALGICAAGLSEDLHAATSSLSDPRDTCDPATYEAYYVHFPDADERYADEQRGAGHNPTGHPIGGGPGYGAWVDPQSPPVRTIEELRQALEAAGNGDVVYVADDAVITMPKLPDDRAYDESYCEGYGFDIPAGVTLASGRGRNGSAGALIYQPSFGRDCNLFTIRGDARITGLRLRGPDQTQGGDGVTCGKDPRAIEVKVKRPPSHWNVEIDNNELYGWPGDAILQDGNIGLRVHHNHIHHNWRANHPCRAVGRAVGCEGGKCNPTAYGVSTGRGHTLIEGNRFDHNRHDIASGGLPGSKYEARYNLVGYGGTSHSFDVHGIKGGLECAGVAGHWFLIHHNTFFNDQEQAVRIRGVPIRGVWVYRNAVAHDTPPDAFEQVNGSGRFYVFENDTDFWGFPPPPCTLGHPCPQGTECCAPGQPLGSGCCLQCAPQGAACP